MPSESIHKIMSTLLSTPVATTREEWISDQCIKLCKKLGIKVFSDNHHNIWLNASSAKDLKEAKLIFVAHIDHPGMSVKSFHFKNGKMYAKAEWLGGGPKFLEGAHVRLFSNLASRTLLCGKIDSYTLNDDRPNKILIEVLGISEENLQHINSIKPWGAYLHFEDIPHGIKQDGTKWVTKSADDLVSVSVLIESLRKYSGNKTVVLLTCSEEVGLKGATEEAKSNIVDKDGTHIIVVDLSKIIDDIKPGNGPIVKYADVDTKFDKEVLANIENAAKDINLKIQIQNKSKGKTDGDVFQRSGYKVGAIAIALENYHNISAYDKPVPEKVDVVDVDQLILLVHRLISKYES